MRMSHPVLPSSAVEGWKGRVGARKTAQRGGMKTPLLRTMGGLRQQVKTIVALNAVVIVTNSHPPANRRRAIK